MQLKLEDYRDKVLGCWLGKNIGGTLGAPFEWRRQLNDVSFYTQDLGGEPLPNDDLDIQLLWLVALEEKGIALDAHTLAEYWTLYVTPHWSEYGTAKINMRAGLLPPLCGNFGNIFKHSCGAYIRAEIWACIAPGLPHVAAHYALQDAMLDHGDGEGTYAEVFIAALESAAFVQSDIRALVDIGLSYIPSGCGVAQAVRTTLECCDNGLSWREARDEILRLHRGQTFFGHAHHTSPRDHELGLADGVLGYDAPSNVALTVLPLLLSDDFGDIVCTAVNCGEDTDCTAATAGSIFGIIHGAGAVPDKWIAPIGRAVKTACLNLGELGYFGDQLPQDVDDLSRRTENIAHQLLRRHGKADFLGQTTDLNGITPAQLRAPASWNTQAPSGPRFEFSAFSIEVDYGASPTIRAGETKTLRVSIRSTGKTQANLSLRWLTPEGWSVSPADRGFALSLPPHLGPSLELEFAVSISQLEAAMNRATLQITIEGQPTVMLVPITLLNGSLFPPASGQIV